MTECIFCKIAKGEIPATVVYEDDKAIAFQDINPQAPTHIIIIPRKHIETFNDITEKDNALMAHLMQVVKQIAKQQKIDKKGYRLVMNCNQNAGQEVFHIHIHLLGGRVLHWPPG